jgi:hypothetical protein
MRAELDDVLVLFSAMNLRYCKDLTAQTINEPNIALIYMR